MRERVKRLYERCGKLDCAVFLNGVEPHLDNAFFYFSGLTDGLFEGCAAVIHPDGGVDLVSSTLEETTARKTDATLHIFKKQEEAEELLRSLLAGKKRIGVNAEELTHASFSKLDRMAPRAEFVDISQEIKETRAVKDGRELELLSEACKIASEVAREAPSLIREGMRESELAAELAYRMQRKGASRPNYCIVAFGPNSAEPHYMSGEAVLRRGDIVLLDFGCVFGRYNSDITRTLVLGRAPEELKRMHWVVYAAQALALDMIRAGVDAKEVHAAVAGYIDATEFKGRFTHSTGHSLGLAVHDGQRIFDQSLILKENMVFTVEPGVYIPGLGGVRIEDDVIVTGGKPRILTEAPRELIEL
ncbi:MAG: Xaa-Pro peptidase family protein [Thermoplasmata archaeon]